MLNELLGVSVACGILYEVSGGDFVAELIQDVNIDLLKQTMDAVNSNPLHHNQSEWHCNTSHCFFWVCRNGVIATVSCFSVSWR